MSIRSYYRVVISLVVSILISVISLKAEIKNLESVCEHDNYFRIQSEFERLFINQDHIGSEHNNWAHRWLWNIRMDFDSKGNFQYLNVDNTKTLNNQEKERKSNVLSQSGWLPVGPISMPPSYDPLSCYSMGRVNCIAFHPSNSKIFWIGTPGGGIWKTEDSGKTWATLSDQLTTLAVSDIAVDPKNPDILYVATGDFDIGGMTSGNSQGVFKSFDGGATWSITGLIFESNFQYSMLRKVIVHPQNTNQLIVAGRRGLWKSNDGGAKWTYVKEAIFTDIEIHPQNPDILYAAMGQLWGGGRAGILKSTDFGDTWTELETGIPPQGQVSRVDIAISPADPDYVYVIAVNSQNNGFHSFYRSTSGGASWEKKGDYSSTDNILGAWGGNQYDNYGQGSYDLVLLPDAKQRDKVYVGGINIWMTENGGSDWDLASFWIYCFGVSIHADHHYAAYNPLDENYYWCNDGGVYRTKEILPGSKDWVNDWVDKYEENALPGHPDVKFPTVWENLSDGLAITEFYRMSLSKNQKNVLAGGSQDNSCFYYNSGDWLNYIPNYDGMETMIDHDNPDIFYGVWQNGGLCKTIDGGKTIIKRLADTISNKERGNWITPTAMDPFNSERIYIGFRNLWRSNNGGFQWEKVINLDTMSADLQNNNSLSIVKISPVDGDYISIFKEASWKLDENQTWVRLPGELWITEDDCLTWRKSTVGLPLDSINIISIDYDHFNPQKIYVAVYSYYNTINTYVTTDGGITWNDISKPLPSSVLIRTIVHQPNSQTNILYAGTNKGVYYTDDSLGLWVKYSDNLPNTIVNQLMIQHSTNELFAATYGRGLWKTNLLPSSVSIHNDESTLLECFPNPAQGHFTISLKSDEKQINHSIIVRILDITGKTVHKESFVISASSFMKVIKPDINNGVYFIQVALNGRNYSTKLIFRN